MSRDSRFWVLLLKVECQGLRFSGLWEIWGVERFWGLTIYTLNLQETTPQKSLITTYMTTLGPGNLDVGWYEVPS